MQAVWNAYVQSMRQACFTPDTPMYVASGLLTYGANNGAAPTLDADARLSPELCRMTQTSHAFAAIFSCLCGHLLVWTQRP